jgi:hypothetical protein
MEILAEDSSDNKSFVLLEQFEIFFLWAAWTVDTGHYKEARNDQWLTMSLSITAPFP